MQNKIALVGDFWNEEEERQRTPFVGVSGYHLDSLLKDAGIVRADCYITTVFKLKPPGGNDVEYLCGPKSSSVPGLTAVKSGKYIKAEYASHLDDFTKEIRAVAPNVIVPLGGCASWAVFGDGRVSKIRGAPGPSSFGKALATYHPTAIVREWSLRPIAVLDLRKALRQSEFPEIRRPKREVWIEPTLEHMELFYDEYLASAEKIAFDIETAGDQITCIGFASSVDRALVIPFTDPRKPGYSYWGNAADEHTAWKFVARVLQTPARKVTQNGLYDVHFLWRRYGITVKNWTEDTMLLHHALLIESQKGLDFLGSIYTDEASWKLMRSRGKGTIKKDE
jgi:uracil-DNA glycosylase